MVEPYVSVSFSCPCQGNCPAKHYLTTKVFMAVREFGPITPTTLGLHLRFKPETACPSMTRPLKTLVKAGLIERIKVNDRVVKYAAIYDENGECFMRRSPLMVQKFSKVCALMARTSREAMPTLATASAISLWVGSAFELPALVLA